MGGRATHVYHSFISSRYVSVHRSSRVPGLTIFRFRSKSLYHPPVFHSASFHRSSASNARRSRALEAASSTGAVRAVGRAPRAPLLQGPHRQGRQEYRSMVKVPWQCLGSMGQSARLASAVSACKLLRLSHASTAGSSGHPGREPGQPAAKPLSPKPPMCCRTAFHHAGTKRFCACEVDRGAQSFVLRRGSATGAVVRRCVEKRPVWPASAAGQGRPRVEGCRPAPALVGREVWPEKLRIASPRIASPACPCGACSCMQLSP